MEEEGEFDEFENEEDSDELEEAVKEEAKETAEAMPKAAMTKKDEPQKKAVGRPPKAATKPEAEMLRPELKQQIEQPQYVAVPKVVSSEDMLNILYEGQMEIIQSLNAIYAKIK